MWGWLRIHWPEHLTDTNSRRCPTCDYPVQSLAGATPRNSFTTYTAHPCGHQFTADPVTRTLIPLGTLDMASTSTDT